MTGDQEGEGLVTLPLTADSAEKPADLVKDRAAELGLGPILEAPTSGSGSVSANPRVVADADCSKMDPGDPVDTITQGHSREEATLNDPWSQTK